MQVLSARATSSADAIRTVFDFFSKYREGVDDKDVRADLTFGNPHEMPLPDMVRAIKARMDPQRPDWFAYKTSEEEPREVIAKALGQETGLPFESDDIAMTPGAFGAIALAFSLLLDPGDECIIPLPGWFCYATTLRARNAVPVQVPLAEDTFDLDIGPIEAAISRRTRLVVVNTPHNPTGVIYSRERLAELAAMLSRKSAELGRPIFILSDEPYRRIRFDGAAFTSPAAVYPHTLIDYSYGKILLSPGLRLGYLAICPTMPEPDRTTLREACATSQVAGGWCFPDAPLQYAVRDLESMGIDMDELQRKRDRMHGALTQWGYQMTKPAGTFYLWGRAPKGDAAGFARDLAGHGVFVMPGTLFDRPTDFRISLTGTFEMIEASLPAFQAAAPA
ncbi:aminotransferase class I/II-fold pyridoxal phosphate-dependent enzyme [Defluviimonas sp. WL0002]|uniref:Aminotransferase class I/II-fold pyridoxal phosphate-dependent enzyme n=1 Tax=Albidovulum marisflavi TaxID=2984159 RepID=A0ABT2Z8R2_9RHOB|nr:aminotransferase class I/II-fold pyridoxal phosphate-dependent enzyme [Defluviimonas sp. WL0002]MCV2867524.1 aminotransferase class I/II-fold pyridoxal phosphate-dependent enzyme [Defluviimonas sp. WL0002]